MPRKMKHKFNAVRCESDGISFASKAERAYYNQLRILQKAGEVLFFLMQVPFRIPGGITYRLDFLEFWSSKNGLPGDVIFTEVKGVMTDSARIKIAQVEEIYGIKINIVK